MNISSARYPTPKLSFAEALRILGRECGCSNQKSSATRLVASSSSAPMTIIFVCHHLARRMKGRNIMINVINIFSIKPPWCAQVFSARKEISIRDLG